jgi:endonuclease YncB( thermonuclease family)
MITSLKKEATMLDVTIGFVATVVDGNTFTMRVTHIGNHNIFTYKNHETVRIANTTVASLSTIQGITAKMKLEAKMKDKKIRCQIHHRDQYNVLTADVEILD